jgi:hypothetical protein
MKLRKIISGGQTGVDRAAMDFAHACGIETGGFVPKDRTAEDGKVPDHYTGLTETESADPAERTELNVINSDATLIISRGALAGGSELTAEFAKRHGKPFLHIDLNLVRPTAVKSVMNNWIASISCSVLNVAGPRASEDPEIYNLTREILEEILG